jgi:hypothetical protein
MKKLALTLLLGGIAIAAWSQPNFMRNGKTTADLFTVKDKSPVTVEGDINKDGINDIVFAVPDLYEGQNVAFYFGQKDGGYKLFRDYEVYLPEKTDLSITDKGVVRFQCNHYDESFDVFLFRFENGDFRLIGGKKDRHKTEHFDESYNYLTGKMIRTDGEGKSRKATTTDMPALPVIRFGWIPLRYDMLDYLVTESEDGPMDADDYLVMGIFRVMQANDMLFWHFCDYENPYRDPHGNSKEGWYAEDTYESYGTYNSYSSLSIEKQSEGVFLIKLSELWMDRSYEAEINEEGSNIDEVLENADPEEEETNREWTFYDGMFTVG